MIQLCRTPVVACLFCFSLIVGSAGVLRAGDCGCASKGHCQSGHCHSGYCHGGYCQHGVSQKGKSDPKKREHAFFSHHPPLAPIFESAAIRTLALPQRTTFRVRQESGDAPPEEESGDAPPEDDKFKKINERLDALEQQVTRLHSSLSKLVDKLQQ